MNEIEHTETMVQDQNPTPAPETGAEQKDTFNVMEVIDKIPDVQTLGAAIEGEQQTATVPAPETPAAPAAEADPAPESPAEDRNLDITTRDDGEMVFPRTIPQDTAISLSESDRDRALKTLQASGYLDEVGRPTDNLLKRIHRLQRRATKSIRVEVSYRVLMSDLEKAGIKFAFAKSNRLIHQPHVECLYNNVQDSEDKCFVETGKIVEAKLLLEEGLELVDENGDQLTLDTAGIEDYFAILDSQHRFIVARNHCDVNLMLEIPDYICPSTEYISIINNEREDWNGLDRKHAIIELKGDSVNILKEIEAFKQTFQVSDKFAEKALTGKKDRFKTDELVEIQLGKKEPGEKYMVCPEMKERAYNIMYAVRAAFGEKEKRIRKIQCIDALYNILDYLDNDRKKDFDANISPFLVRGMDDKDKSIFLSRVADPAKEGDPDKFIWQKYNDFVKSYSDDDFEIISQEAFSEIEKVRSVLDAEPKAKRKTPKLKMGTPSDILRNMEAIKVEEEKKAAEKKAKAAEKEASVK